MKSEIKIVLPLYKLIFSILFILFFSIIRNIVSTIEIGSSLDQFMAILASVLMADTYLMEEKEQRWELYALYPYEKKRNMLYKRTFIQICYTFILSAIGYALFFIQRPRMDSFSIELSRYFEFLFVVMITISFFGTLTLVISNYIRNMWCGIGITLILWLFLLSMKMQEVLGKYNIYAYVSRFNKSAVEKQWLPGIGIALICTIILFMILPKTIGNRRI